MKNKHSLLFFPFVCLMWSYWMNLLLVIVLPWTCGVELHGLLWFFSVSMLLWDGMCSLCLTRVPTMMAKDLHASLCFHMFFAFSPAFLQLWCSSVWCCSAAEERRSVTFAPVWPGKHASLPHACPRWPPHHPTRGRVLPGRPNPGEGGTVEEAMGTGHGLRRWRRMRKRWVGRDKLHCRLLG